MLRIRIRDEIESLVLTVLLVRLIHNPVFKIFVYFSILSLNMTTFDKNENTLKKTLLDFFQRALALADIFYFPRKSKEE